MGRRWRRSPLQPVSARFMNAIPTRPTFSVPCWRGAARGNLPEKLRRETFDAEEALVRHAETVQCRPDASESIDLMRIVASTSPRFPVSKMFDEITRAASLKIVRACADEALQRRSASMRRTMTRLHRTSSALSAATFISSLRAQRAPVKGRRRGTPCRYACS